MTKGKRHIAVLKHHRIRSGEPVEVRHAAAAAIHNGVGKRQPPVDIGKQRTREVQLTGDRGPVKFHVRLISDPISVGIIELHTNEKCWNYCAELVCADIDLRAIDPGEADTALIEWNCLGCVSVVISIKRICGSR